MRSKIYGRLAGGCLGMTTAFVPLAAYAEPMDGSKNIVCSVVDVVGCTESGQCTEGSARSFELPQFLIMDAGKKVIRAAYEAGQKDISSPVKNVENSGDHLILQGVENGRGWDIAINTKTGNMSASGVGDAVSFLLFGACTAL
jgi:hypothetical protein